MDSKAHEVLEHYNRIKPTRYGHEERWAKIAERMWTSYTDVFLGNSGLTAAQSLQGQNKTRKEVDRTASLALDKYASVAESLMTPFGQEFHDMELDDEILNRDRNVRLWLEEITRILFQKRSATQANWQSQNRQVLKSTGAFGNGVLFTGIRRDPRYGVGVYYRAIPLNECYFDQNEAHVVDTLIRDFWLTGRQLAQAFDLTGDLLTLAKEKPLEKFQVIHRVKPNDDLDPERLDAKGMPFESAYLEMRTKELLVPKGQADAVGGHRTFPYSVNRFDVAPNEVYARGLGEQALPNQEVLNKQKETFLRHGHLAVAPAYLTTDDMVRPNVAPNAINPGGINPTTGRPNMQPLQYGNPAFTLEMMQEEKLAIQQTMKLDLFQILVESPGMTATEVLERMNEKAMFLAPEFGRQMESYLGPHIDRELDLLADMGVLPPPPPIVLEALETLGGLTLKPRYKSPVARMRESEKAAASSRFLQESMEIANVTGDPSYLDVVRVQKMQIDNARIRGVPEDHIASPEEIQAKQEARAQAQASQEEIQAAPGAAALLKAGAVASQA